MLVTNGNTIIFLLLLKLSGDKLKKHCQLPETAYHYINLHNNVLLLSAKNQFIL